jgi:hypothetical protein
MKILTFILIIASFLTQCPQPCEDEQIIDNGVLTEEALLKVPYQNGEIVKLKHSAGHIINFKVTRESEDRFMNNEHECGGMIEKCNLTILNPDYPIFTVTFNMSNYDGVSTLYYLNIGYYSFILPEVIESSEYLNVADSLIINNKTYYNVLKSKSSYGSTYYDTNLIYADSLYYNYDSGIIKIIMSNHEFYEIFE